MIKMQIDPRIKLLSMVLISFIALTGTTTGHAVYPRLVIILIPTFCLLYLHYYKAGLLCFFILFYWMVYRNIPIERLPCGCV